MPINGTLLSPVYWTQRLVLTISLLALSAYIYAQGTVTTTYSYTGGAQSFVVPVGVDSITIDMRGASGGLAYFGGSIGSGGLGGRLQATIPVTPGSTLSIYVGGSGTNATSGSGGGGGFNGGANGGAFSTTQAGGGGGGASDIRSGGAAFSNRIAVAAGGGGASSCGGSPFNGGAGGGLTGAGGTHCGGGTNPTGGTQTTGGSGGSYGGYCTAAAGSFGLGGAGCSPSGGGGAGGGYYGGGGGAWASGGGGSSYSVTGSSNVIHTSGFQSGNGFVSITYTTYCTSVYTYAGPYGCSDGDYVNNFNTTGGTTNISNNGTGCSVNAYGNYTSQAHTEGHGETVTFSVQSGPTWANGFAIWVDWNNNYSFESTELMWSSGSASTSVFNGSFVIPFATPIGSYRMRVRSAYNTVPTDACSAYTYGEAEDYTITVESPYCAPSITNGCSLGDYINNFSTSGGGTNITNNGSGCNGSAVGDYTTLIHTSSPGEAVGLSVQSGPTYAQGFAIYVDWNKDGVYGSTEQVWNSGTASTGTFTGSFNVPCSQDTGTTYMRVVANYNALPPSACGSQTYGEAEDYTFEVAWDTIPPIVIGNQDTTVYLDNSGQVTVNATELDSATAANNLCALGTTEAAILPKANFDPSMTSLGSYNGHQYFISNTATFSWFEAEALAESLGGQLVTINDASENTQVATWANAFSGTPWIGLNDTASEGTWVWEGGSSNSYTNWNGGEPNNGGGNEDCAEMYTGSGTWNDAPCTNLDRFIVEVIDTLSYGTSITFNCDNLDSNFISLKITDSVGNPGLDTVSVIVIDSTSPSISGSSSGVYLTASGTYTVNAADFSIATSDNCTVDSTWNNSNGTYYCADSSTAIPITFYAQDQSGNIDSATVTMFIFDTVSPTVIAEDVDLYLDSNGIAVLTDTTSTEATGLIYFTSTQGNRIYAGSVDTLGAPWIVRNSAAGGSAGPVGIVYAPHNDSLYYGGGNYSDVYRSSIDGSGSVYTLPNASAGFEHHDVAIDPDSNRLFFTNGAANEIRVANLDGTGGGSTVVYDAGSSYVLGLDYDRAGNRLYFTELFSGEVVASIQPNGNDYTVLYNSTDGVNGPRQLAIDEVNQNVYWVNRTSSNVMMGSMDGTATATILYASQSGIFGIDVDPEADGVYWTRFGGTDRVMRGNLDGTLTAQTLFSGNFNSIRGITTDALSVGMYMSDNCAISSFTIDPDTFYCADTGVNVVTVTAWDSSGNSTQVTLNATIYDTLVPSADGQNYTVALDASGMAVVSADSLDSASFDNCALDFSLSDSVFTCADSGNNNVWFYATDAGGNVDSDMVVITVIDTSAPTVITQNISVQLSVSGSVTIDTSDVNNGSSDNCAISSMQLDIDSFNCAGVDSTHLVVLTVTDVSGNSDTAHAYVTVTDIIAPTVVTQNDTVYLDSSGNGSITAAMIDNGTSDNCTVDSIYLDVTTFDCADVGSNTVTLSADDQSGNTGTNTATVIVIDSVAPIASSYTSIDIYLDATGNYTLTSAEVDSASSDACGIDTYTLDITAFDCSDIGTPVSVTMTVTDVNGNSSTANTVVIVNDTLAPTVVTQNITVYLDNSGAASIVSADVDNGSSDACGIVSYSLDDSTFNCADTGANVVTLTVADLYGNIDSAPATVTVMDSTSPAASAITVDTAYLDATGNVTISAVDYDNGSTDNCAIAEYYLSDSTFTCADTGLNAITLFVRDVSSNVGSVSTSVMVMDTTRPNIVLTGDTFYLDSTGQITLTAADIDGGTSDNCAINSLSIDTSFFDCDAFNQSFNILFTAVDVSGNIAVDSIDIVITDTITPVVLTQNVTIALDSFGDASIGVVDVNAGSNDPCGIDSLWLSDSILNCSYVGVNTITLFVQDTFGNIGSNTATLTVLDTIAPHIIAAGLTVYLDSFGAVSLTPAQVNTGIWDSCGVDSIVLDSSNFGCNNVGTPIVVGITATDVNGNSSFDTVNITVEDSTAPFFDVQDITVYLDSSGNVTINESMIDLGTWDNCSLDSTWLSTYNFTCADTLANTVKFYAIDTFGNLDSTNIIVTVLDTQPPVVLAQNLTLYLDENGSFSINADTIDIGSSDNCAINSTWLSDSVFTCADTAGPNTIYLYAEDISGNLDSAMSIITVFDTTRPIVLVQSITVYLDSFGNTSIVPGDLDNGSSDNCTIDSTWLSMYDFDCGHAPDSHSVTLFVRDVSGNLHQNSAFVTVLDTVAPQPIIQNLTIYLDVNGEAIINADSVNVGTWDSCGIDTTYLSQDTFNCIDVGSNNITFYAVDIHGNIDSAISTIQVNDTIAPVIVIVDTQFIYLDSFGLATTTADSVDISTSDACGINTISIDTSSFDCGNHGDTLNVLFTAIDENGNTSYDSLILVIADTLAPYIFAHSDTVYLDSNGQFVMYAESLDDSTFDNCTLDTIYLSDTLYTCSTVDSTIDVTFTAEDIFGNQSTDTLQVAVIDTIHPIITCNDSIIVLNDSGDCGAIVNFAWPTAWDNCTVDSIVQIDTNGLDSGSFFPVGFTELTYVAYDQSLNTDTCSFIIEVQDWEAPQLFCQNDTAICDSIFTYSIPQYIDNCTYHTVVLDSGLESGEFYPVGLTINRFIVTDLYGNADTCQFEVFRYDYPSVAEAGEDQEKCEEYTGTLDATTPAIGTGFWSVISGPATIADSTLNNSSISDLEVGMTHLEWRVENGVCPIERDTMGIEIYLNPIAADAGDDVVVCDSVGAEITANLGSIGIGTWLQPSDGTTLADTNQITTQVDGLALGTYSYTWKVVNGVCPPSFDDMTVSVVPYPEVRTLLDTTYIFAPSSVDIEATSDLDVTYEWWPDIDLTNGDQAIATVQPSMTTTYYVDGTTEDGCLTTDTILVEVNEGLNLPTAFTPDGDNFNDVWNLKELANYPDCVVKIYNRWGNLMFESNGYVESWDGTFNDKPLPSGSYFFVVELGVPEVPPITGSITIIR